MTSLWNVQFLMVKHTAVQPGGDDGEDVINLLIGKLFSSWDVVPFAEAFSAAGCGGVLGDKDRVAFHWCLFSIL